MKKTRKVQLLATILGTTAAVAGLTLLDAPAQANADERAAFAMTNGAAVRAVQDEAGIRWETSVNKAWYDANIATIEGATDISFGTLVTSANNVTAGGLIDVTALTAEAAEVKNLVCASTPNFANETTFTYYSSIVYNNMSDWTEEERKAAYATELVARSYVKYTLDGETKYKYADANDNARCMRAVALAAYEETDPEKVLDADKKSVVDDYFATAEEEFSVDGDDGVCATAEANFSDYTIACIGAKKVGTIVDGKLTLNADFAYNTPCTLTLFDADGNYARTATSSYITQYINTAEDFTKALQRGEGDATTVWGYYVLAQNIALTGTWATYTTFSGTLDGQNHTITGLTLSKGQLDHNGGLFHELGNNVTIKDVAVVDVKMGSETSGVFSFYAKQGAVTFDNVYVSISSDTVFGEFYTDAEGATLNELVLKNQSQKAGLVNRGNDADITVNNCVIYMPETLSQASGFICSYGSPKLTITGTTFIGGNGALVGKRSGTSSNPKYTNGVGVGYQVIDAVQAYKDLYGNDFDKTVKDNANVWSAMIVAAYEANHPLKVWGASDFTTTNLDNLTTGDIIVLTEDVTVEGKFSKGIISGVFDGQGHKISGIIGQSNKGGLFSILQGSIKNVAFAGDFSSDNMSVGLVANTVQYNAYLENVYCEVKFNSTLTGDKVYGQGGIFRVVGNFSTSLSMKNVVVNVQGDAMADISGAILGYGSTVTKNALGVYMDNCSYIAPSAQPMGSRGNTDSAFGQVTGANEYFFWNAEYDEEGNLTKADDGLTYYGTKVEDIPDANLTDDQKTWLGRTQSN